ncbi:glycoside hydrolase [Ascobolus immersus RN42]|uniref:chitinase n=1 Tax=Ascobolus immersus RN42 TaxID=1160509 RepID=A0A3N4IN35_ASCIM|nr:glycoside hydrolase [Ascobolus immersus RN42]
MPPIIPPKNADLPERKLVIYHQTHYHNGQYVPILPVLDTPITHVILGCLHISDTPGVLALNDHPPSHSQYDRLWQDIGTLQESGIPVSLMIGGAAKGAFALLDAEDYELFRAYYDPLLRFILERNLDGIDLDVEEPMSLPGIIRLIVQLRSDMAAAGRPNFLITLAPVAKGLVHGNRHLSGFSYFMLEKAVGKLVDWYNAQFYCGWGDVSTPDHYNAVIMNGWSPERIVMGIVTNGANGSGWVQSEVLGSTIKALVKKWPTFGGVSGWEWFNALGEGGLEARSTEDGGPQRWGEMVGRYFYPDDDE